MFYLAFVSVLWAFSFGLIGNRLAGLDSNFVATARLGLAMLCFLPFLRLRGMRLVEGLGLAALGGLQFGVMYVAYIRAYAYLPSHLVALFTVLTPLYVVATNDLLARRFHARYALCAALSVLGAGVIKFSPIQGDVWLGFVLVQVANLAFGVGQTLYRRWRRARPDWRDREVFALPYAGGVAVAALAFVAFGDPGAAAPDPSQGWVLLYLGLIASGLGFFLWNKGAVAVSPGALAAFNNAVVPLAMLVSLFVFGEAKAMTAEMLGQLAAGSLLIFAAIVLGSRRGAPGRIKESE